MSYAKRIELFCDECEEATGALIAGDVKGARKEARTIGWACVAGRDLCPGCVADRNTRRGWDKGYSL